jgi:hypothetical protein
MSRFNRHTYTLSAACLALLLPLLNIVCEVIIPPVVKTSISLTCLNGNDRPGCGCASKNQNQEKYGAKPEV